MLIVIAAIGALTAGVQGAVAGGIGQHNAPGVTGAVVPTSTVVGKRVTQVKIVRQTGEFSEFFTSSTSFVDVGLETSITVPAGTHAIILARFSAESACSGGSDADWCSIRIRIGGVDGMPVPSGSEFFAFDSPDGGSETSSSWEVHAMERSCGGLGPGTYVVRVQAAVSDATLTFYLDDMNLTVERIKQ